MVLSRAKWQGGAGRGALLSLQERQRMCPVGSCSVSWQLRFSCACTRSFVGGAACCLPLMQALLHNLWAAAALSARLAPAAAASSRHLDACVH